MCLKCCVGLLDTRRFRTSSATENHRDDEDRLLQVSTHTIDAVDGHSDGGMRRSARS